MTKFARLVVVATALALVGCGSSPTTPATDPESIKKLEELQKKGSQGEGGAKEKK